MRFESAAPLFLSTALVIAATHAPASAQTARSETSVSTTTVSTTNVQEGGADIGDDPFELGVFAGAAFPMERNNAEGADSEDNELNPAAFEAGLRLGLYPIQYLGIEGEGAGIWGKAADTNAIVGAGRLHVVGQLPVGIVAPFVVAGGGIVGSECEEGGCDDILSGRKAEPVVHFGAGLKLGLASQMHLRLDLRDNMAAPDEHIPEALLGLAVTLGGANTVIVEEKPKDSDGDGLLDPQDYCPLEPAQTPNGCPIKDRDGDGKADDVDECPDVASPLPNGCPDPDPDKDGIPAETDKCPDVAGIGPDGCPDPDPDKDGISGADDKCPTEAEVPNGFEDKDGCPDELPEKVQKFSGTIQGIYFEFGKAVIQQASFPILDEAAAVLAEYPDLRIRIEGHTDSKGTPERNLELSQQRAQAVADYLINKGVETSRIEAVGYGEDQPVATNDTDQGRKQNRRIEFEILK
jgi:OOP family OmpA-OmpF porin